MQIKVCKMCGLELPVTDFYEDKTMREGRVNQCKYCIQKQARERRWTNLERIKQKDAERANQPHRKKLRYEIGKRRRQEVEGYQKAHNAVTRAVEHGEIERSNTCQICGDQSRKTEAHHCDYEQIKDVIWLCPTCHRNYHLGKSDKAIYIRQIIDLLLKVKCIS